MEVYRLYYSLICVELYHWDPPFQNGCTWQRLPLVRALHMFLIHHKHRLSAPSYFNSPPPDDKAFSLLATAYGLQSRFNAQTLTKHKYAGNMSVPMNQPCSTYDICLIAHSKIKIVVSRSRGLSGQITRTFFFVSRCLFYSVFNFNKSLSEPRATLIRSVLLLISHFIFLPKLVCIPHRFFPSTATHARLLNGQLSHRHLRPSNFLFHHAKNTIGLNPFCLFVWESGNSNMNHLFPAHTPLKVKV